MAGVFKYLDRLECFQSNAVNGRPDIVQSICTCWLVPFDMVFPYVASNSVFYLACFSILLYHWRRNSSWASRVNERLGTPTQTWRMISRHIVILNLYYNPRIAGRFQFTTSVFAILVDDCLLYYAVTKIMEEIFGEQRDSGDGVDSGTESVGVKKFDPFDNEMRTPVRASDARSAMADSTYQDLTRDFSKVLGLFIMQAGLFTLYVKHMNAPDAPSKDRNQVNFFYWCLGVLIQLFSANSQLGRSYNQEWWSALAKIDFEGRMSSGWDQLRQMFHWKPHARELGRRKHRVLCVRVPYSVDWTTRRGMDWFVNSVIRETLKFTTPILVNSEEPLDFVKDCMAIFFLTQLDDLTEEFSLSIFELRALVKYSILHRSKCRELWGMTLHSIVRPEVVEGESFRHKCLALIRWALQNFVGLEDEEGGLQENFIRQVELTEDEKKAVEAGLRSDKKVAWRRVKKEEFHRTQVRNLLDSVLG